MLKSLQIWWQTLRLFARHVPVLEADPEWTEGDAKSLAIWLRTESGKKFQRLLANNQAKANRSATMPREEAQYSCGFAAGYSASAALFKTLSAIGQPEPAEEQQLATLGGKELAELLAP